ncbi:MAG: hypothetical protein QXO16_08535 [Archaeoglobaceae archaeon]
MYPGQYDYWQILWIQIALLVYVQFTTALSLYSQKEVYSKPFAFLERFLRWKKRDLLVKIHAFSGITVFVLNIVCTTTWFYLKLSGGISIFEILSTGDTAVIGWVNILTTALITTMFIFGVSLYRNNVPSTVLPFWKFEYNFSRLLHRLAFVFLVFVLGYHVLFISKIATAWMEWLLSLHPFAILPITAIIIGSLALALALIFVHELLTGKIRGERSVDLLGSFILSTCFLAVFTLFLCLWQPFQIELLASMLFFSAVVAIYAKSQRTQPLYFKTIPMLQERILEFRDYPGFRLALEEVIDHAINSWKEKMDLRREAEFCGSIMASLWRRGDIEELNRLEDLGRDIAFFVWKELSKGEFDVENLKSKLGVV